MTKYFMVVVIACVGLVSGAAHAVDVEPITHDRPLFVFHLKLDGDAPDSLAAVDRLLADWRALPERLRPWSAMEIDSPGTSESLWPDRFRDVLRELQFAQTPIILRIANADPESYYPIDALRELLDEFSMIRGVHAEGLSFAEYPTFGDHDRLATPPQAQWLAAVIDLAAQYGRRVLVELDGLEWVHLMSNTWTRELYDVMALNASVVVPMNSQRGPLGMVASDAAMGLWLEGAADQWGLRCDSGWYRSAHFAGPGKFGDRSDVAMPPELFRALVLNGALAGATVYRFSEPSDLWFDESSAYWKSTLGPLLDDVLTHGYIARKNLVRDKVRVAYRLNSVDSLAAFAQHEDDLDPVFHAGRMLRGSYGVDRAGQISELIPDTGRYYRIPVLSPYATDEALAQFDEVILPGALLDAQAWRERLASYYEPDGDGTAFIVRIGRGIFVMHTRENLYESQTFSLPEVPAHVRQITAQRTPEGVALTWPFRERDVFYRVYRRVPPEETWNLISSELDTRTFLDPTASAPDTLVAYAVTALTNEMEPYAGTVNFGDYRVIDTVESRISEQVVLEPNATAATGAPMPPEVDPRPASQAWWPNLDNVTGDALFAGQAIAEQIESLELAYRTEDLDALTAMYAADYKDARGWGREYVRAAFGALFKGFDTGPMRRQIRAWDFSAMTTEGRVGVRMYARWMARTDARIDGASRTHEISFPNTPTDDVLFTFTKSGDRWLISATDPPVPNLDDILQENSTTP